MNDNELFELCKQVYRVVPNDWVERDMAYWTFDGSKTVRWNDMTAEEQMTAIVPLYTSDYLLEKLPKKVEGADWSYWLTLSPMDGESWDADYEFEDTEPRHFEYADTPLKALLKLTLALHEAGVLVQEKAVNGCSYRNQKRAANTALEAQTV